MKTQKEIIIGEIRTHLSGAGHTTKTNMRRSKKLFSRLSPTGLLLLGIGLTAAVLLGIQGSYLVINQQDINTEGSTLQVYFDGVQLIDPIYQTPADTFTDDKLVPGETETFTHTVSSPINDGDWELWWDIDANMTWFDDPLHMFYGYYFSTTNAADEPIESMVVMHGETKDIKFVHSLDPHFQEAADPIPFNLQMHIVPFVQAPDANDDTYHYGMGQYTQDLVVTSNDVDHSGNGLQIVSTTMGTINPDGLSIHFVGAADHVYDFTYTIRSLDTPLDKQDTANVHISFS